MYKTFRILLDEKPPVRKAGWYAVMVFSHGDADSYDTEYLPVAQDSLINLANFLQRCYDTTSESAGGPGYRKIPGYEIWGQDFPRDVTCSSVMAKLDAFHFIFVNDAGVEFDILLEK